MFYEDDNISEEKKKQLNKHACMHVCIYTYIKIKNYIRMHTNA